MTREEETLEKLVGTQMEYFVYIETNITAKASRDPCNGGHSLMAKVLDMICGGGERKAVIIQKLRSKATEPTTSEVRRYHDCPRDERNEKSLMCNVNQ